MIILLSAMLFVGCVTTKMPPRESRILSGLDQEFITTDFRIIKECNQLNPQVLAILTSPNGMPIANPGEKYNVGDGIDGNLSSMGLMFGGVAENMEFVYFGQTGADWIPVLMIAKLENDLIVKSCQYRIDFEGWELYEQLERIKKYFPYISHKIEGLCEE